jgi:phage repressor protein C with HTH and peptisase S24 domain
MADRFGLGENTWARLEREDRPPKGNVLTELVAVGFSSDWILTGEGEMRRDDPQLAKRLAEIQATLDSFETPIGVETVAQKPAIAHIHEELKRTAEDVSTPWRNRAHALSLLSLAFGDRRAEEMLEASSDHFIRGMKLGGHLSAGSLPPNLTFLPRYDVQASAGAGSVVQSEQIIDFVAFDTGWLRQTLGIDPKRAAVITAMGDSMYPTIADGDVLVLDLSIDRVHDNAIYALRFGDSLSVKRVQLRPTGGLRIISDNAKYPPDELGPDAVRDLHVIGRIVWHGGVM